MVAIIAASSTAMQVISLARFAVKGLHADGLNKVQIDHVGDTFPDDRRYALLKRDKKTTPKFSPSEPEWIHKDNFLCAFTAPELMSTFDTDYDDMTEEERKMFTVWKRDNINPRSEPPLLGPVDLSKTDGRDEVSNFFTQACGEYVDLVCSSASRHTHQFGNTSSGVKARGDTRTVHIVNAATVREFSEKIGMKLRPSRFKPNIVVDGLEPWKEFDFVGKTLEVQGGLKMDVIKQTVRCDGIGIDPLDDASEMCRLDIPKLLMEHYPEHGPYFGVYAVISETGSVNVGDSIKLVSHDD